MTKNGLLLWVVAGAGVLFLYSAVTNTTPQSVLASQLGKAGRVPISTGTLPATETETVTAKGYNVNGELVAEGIGKEYVANRAKYDPYAKAPKNKVTATK